MALPVSERLKALLSNTVKSPQLIVEIDGLPPFSSIPSQKYAVYGDPIVYGQPGLVYGGLINDPRVFPYIDISKSTNQISQQLLTDKGGFSSTTNFEIALVDKDQMISELISPGFVVDDILSKKAKLYLSLQGAAHPQESVLFFTGIVSDVSANAGLIKINISSPEKLKNQEIFPKVSTELAANVLVGDTVLQVGDTSGLLLPADSGTLRCYVRINDEIIEYTGVTATTITGCTRGQLNTVAAAHSTGDNVESFYRLTGNLRDLSLKLMLSGDPNPYLSDEPILAFNTYGGTTAANAIFLNRFNIEDTIGVVAGDTITVTGSTSNDGTYTVLSTTSFDLGSYIVVDGVIASEIAAGTISLQSKYNVLPSGAGLSMSPDQVDVPQFERIYSQFSASFFNYDFYIKDQVNGAEFINTQILYPSGAYAIPRKAKTSIGLTIPPLAQNGTKKLDGDFIVGASKIAIRRSISKNFYNAVVYKYDPDSIEDRYLRGKIRQSADSTNRIKVANKPLTIEADGVRTSGNFDFIFETQSRRFLDRYQFAAEFFETEVLFGTGFDIEIADTVILDGRSLNITDTKTGNRIFEPRLFEVQNKTYSLTGKTVKLTLVDTAYSLNVRYGVISPSSKIGTGSTTSQIVLTQSFSDSLFNYNPTTKWQNYVGERVLIHDKDWVFQEETRIVGFNPANPAIVVIDPPLSVPPSAGMIFDTAKYNVNGTDPADNALTKASHCFTTKQVVVASGVSGTVFTVASGDEIYFRPGAVLQIHDQTYSVQSPKVEIESVVGTTITVNDPLGFTPTAGHFVEFLGYKDGGASYSFI